MLAHIAQVLDVAIGICVAFGVIAAAIKLSDWWEGR